MRNMLTSMIRSFKCRHTQALFEGNCPRQFRAIRAVAERKLTMLDNAETLEFLRSPAGNRLEKLSGDREGEYSIRINKQFRVCFAWDGEPYDVAITDYH